MEISINQQTFNTIYFTEMGFAAILFGVNILVSIFLCNEFRKPQSKFRSPYFYILNSYYCLRIPYTVAWVYGRTFYYRLDDPLLPYVLLLQWYCQSLQGIWEAVLGLSRMTALAFPKLHTFLWSGKRFWYFFAIIYLFPFYIHGDAFFHFDCKFLSSSAPGCLDYRRDTVRRNAILTIVLSCLCLIFVLTGIAFAHASFDNKKQSKMEKRVVFQTVLSAVFVTLLYSETLVGYFSETKAYLITSWFFSMLQFYPPMFIVFMMTPNVKKEFIAFYFWWLQPKQQVPVKITPSASVTVF